MRAIAVNAFRATPELVELPKPEPGAGEVRVRVEYAALNPCDWQTVPASAETPGSCLDTPGSPGTASPGRPADAPVAAPALPLVVGVDFAGWVDKIGSGPNRFRVGDQVFGRTTPVPGTSADARMDTESGAGTGTGTGAEATGTNGGARKGNGLRTGAGVGPAVTGTYCDYMTVSQDSAVTLVPSGLPLKVAAALPSAGMAAAQILETVALRGHESLLVIGAAGGVGCCLTQLAAARDVRVIAAVRGDERGRMAALGAAATVDTLARPLEEAIREVCPDGVDALVDLVSTTPDAFTARAAPVRVGGIALTTRGVAAKAALPIGVTGIDFRLEPTPVLLDVLAAGVVEGVLRVPIDVELPLERAPQALDRNRAGGARGKTVIAL
ncbi:alcohol dehydrogenase catalytic domain-containing protein [Streptomyces sp. NPDC001834]|uniref:alcohol dehydrogenase catalytic domain-containing protein n=1 Tax=Streptomyces sp. NPDC001834 TaxID=3364616 RepID=UPI0036B2E77B